MILANIKHLWAKKIPDYRYTLIRSNRKSLALEITRELEIIVRAPNKCSQRDIDGFLVRYDHWLKLHLARQEQRLAAHPPSTPEEKEALRQKAKVEIPPRVDYFSKLMGLYPTNIKITSAEKRFGSCSGKNALCFSYRLMAYPPEAVDYVIVHELAHIAEKNHGRDFYRLIAQVLPDYKTQQAMLKE